MPWSNQNGKGDGPWGKSEKKDNKDADAFKEKQTSQDALEKNITDTASHNKPYSAFNSPWGNKEENPQPSQKPFGINDLPPDVKKIFKKGQNKFQQSGNGGLFAALFLILFASWLFQCFYTVQQNEKAVQLWLGQPEDQILTEGLHFRFWPFETYYTVPLTEQNIAIGYGHRGEENDSLMLSGDQNIVNVRFLIYYNIENPIAYLFNVKDPVGTIRQVAESAMREVVGRRPIDDVYRDKREEVANDVLAITQATVNKYGLGVRITRISISEAAPPAKVAAAFNSVQQAEQERNRVIEEGNKIRATKLGLANGSASRKRAEAAGEKARMIEEAQGRAERFKLLEKEESANPKLVRYRIYMETLGELLSAQDKLIIDKEKAGVVPYLPLNNLLGDKTKMEGKSLVKKEPPEQDSGYYTPSTKGGQ